MLQDSRENGTINIDCVDPLGRTALLMAIDNENLEMVEVLLENKVETKDALLHAINEEFVEAVEVLLDHEESIHVEGQPWVRNENCSSSFVCICFSLFLFWLRQELKKSLCVSVRPFVRSFGPNLSGALILHHSGSNLQAIS